jgi:hypothetical protein
MLTLPDTSACRAAEAFARKASDPSLFNHAMRTFAFGLAAAEIQHLVVDRELFFLGAVLHDLGLTELAAGKERFEIEGADLARQLLAKEGVRDADLDIVWDAIALHTTAGVPPRKRPEIALVQLGAAIDIGLVPLAAAGDAAADILGTWPRLAFKRCLPQALLAAYRRGPASLTSQVVADTVERELGVRGPNLYDVIVNAPFAE